jgi:hypothetical protein
MKITMEIDCTPTEARALMGLPDLTPIHDAYLDKVKGSMEGGIRAETLQAIIKNWAPMGEAGLLLWKQLVDQAGAANGDRPKP